MTQHVVMTTSWMRMTLRDDTTRCDDHFVDDTLRVI